MIKEEIDEKALGLAKVLEDEFFDIEWDRRGTFVIGQHRVLKEGKSLAEFNSRHGEIWQNHEAELIESGFMEPRSELPQKMGES